MIFNWKKIALITIIGVAFVVLCPVARITRAQTIPNVSSYDTSINEGDFDLEVTPENPSAFDTVTIKVTSSLVDTNRYPIIWSVNNSVVLSGIGERTVTIKMKDYGQSINVIFSIKLIDSTIQKRLSLTPQDTTMLWEAVDSYVPPFYSGKKLPTYESLVRIAAVPNFLKDKRSLATKDAVYNWSRNKSVVPNAGGYGKDSILIMHNRIRPSELLEVDASSTDGSSAAHAQITIPFYNPKIVFYERNPISGIKYSLATNSIFFNTDSTIVEAIPYFFSVTNKNVNSLKFSWAMNNKAVVTTDLTNKNRLTLQKPDASGSAKIDLSVENTSKLFQSAKSSLSVLFKK